MISPLPGGVEESSVVWSSSGVDFGTGRRLDVSLPPGVHEVTFVAASARGGAGEDGITIAIGSASRPFLRGDGNGDGRIDIGDALASLYYSFLEVGPVTCERAADFDDNGALELTDAISL